MGYGLPAAIGAQVANPGALVVCVSGDGSVRRLVSRVQVRPAKLPKTGPRQ